MSEWGCGFHLSFEVERDALVALRTLGTQPYCVPNAQPVMFQIVYSNPEAGGWNVGASKIQPEKLWEIDAMDIPPIGSAVGKGKGK